MLVLNGLAYSQIYTYIYEYIYLYVFTYTYIKYILQNIRNKIYVYVYLWQDNDQFVSTVKHVITNKEESFHRKGLASIIANMVHK